jgi:hypothetical protein
MKVSEEARKRVPATRVVISPAKLGDSSAPWQPREIRIYAHIQASYDKDATIMGNYDLHYSFTAWNNFILWNSPRILSIWLNLANLLNSHKYGLSEQFGVLSEK